MKILVTGARGFIGRNLVEALEKNNETAVYSYDRGGDNQPLEYYAGSCDFLFHLTAVHRPEDPAEFEKVNHLLFADLLQMLRNNRNNCPVLLPSSIQAGDHTAYGQSKLAAEKALTKHSELTGARAIIYRLTNTFGRYAKPDHHSVVATFCYNIARNLPIVISNPDRVMKFYYIDDVIDSFLVHVNNNGQPDADGFYRLPEGLEYEITLQELADKIRFFKSNYDAGLIPECHDGFTLKLHETYLSYCDNRAEEGL